jgi:hypothetical protein
MCKYLVLFNPDVGIIYINSQYVSVQMYLNGFVWDFFLPKESLAHLTAL